jgi:hypothetical protein
MFVLLPISLFPRGNNAKVRKNIKIGRDFEFQTLNIKLVYDKNIMKRILFLTLSIVFFGCSSKSDKYVVIFKHGNGIIKGMPVFVNEKQVGKIESIGLDENLEAAVIIDINGALKIPNDSRFRSTILKFNSNAIIIEMGDSKKHLNFGDTVYGILHY